MRRICASCRRRSGARDPDGRARTDAASFGAKLTDLFCIAPTSKSALARVSKPAGLCADMPTWKSAPHQVWKPAPRHIARSALNRYKATADRLARKVHRACSSATFGVGGAGLRLKRHFWINEPILARSKNGCKWLLNNNLHIGMISIPNGFVLERTHF